MTNELMKQTVTYFSDVKIEDQILGTLVDLSDEDVTWLKLSRGGFIYEDKTLPEISGQIFSIYPYIVRWQDKKPEKRPLAVDQEPPEGFNRRCDINSIKFSKWH